RRYAKEWKKKTGGKVLGYFCHYFPEELVYAAGVLPIRVISEYDNDGISRRYLYDHFCGHSLGLLAQGLKGNYDFLDGIGYAECCMAIRGAVASWWSHVPTNYKHFVSMPMHVDHPSAKTFLRTELSAFKRELEEWTGKPITDKDLDHAIDVYNTSRSLMRQVYELRRLDNTKVSGTEAFDMIASSQTMDKEEHNKLLKDALSKLPKRKVPDNNRARIMLLGSEISETSLVRLIESMGATVVADFLCNGSNYIWNNVIPQDDLLMAIAERYLDRLRCPMKDTVNRRRPRQIMDLALDYNVQGVVYAIQRFCHPHQWDRHLIEEAFKEKLIPLHNIEYDGSIPMMEFQTRIEAFIDTVRK
ncbi:2-hydroxyacyl-CoA dehydratase subunit D, partial [Chloroflexota bacterium]